MTLVEYLIGLGLFVEGFIFGAMVGLVIAYAIIFPIVALRESRANGTRFFPTYVNVHAGFMKFLQMTFRGRQG